MPTLKKVLAEGSDSKAVWMTPSQSDVLEVLEHCNTGGVAGVHGYIATSKRITPETADYQVITRFNYGRLLQRAVIAVKGVDIADVNMDIIPDHKLKGKTRAQWFVEAKAKLIESAKRTLDGNRNDARRQGHDRCYVKFADGVKAHLLTEKRQDGLMHPVLTDGYPTVESIKLSVLVLNKTVTVEGEYKPVNSGALVLAKNAINKVLNQRSIGLRTLSLKAGNFDSLTIDHNVIIDKDIKDLMD